MPFSIFQTKMRFNEVSVRSSRNLFSSRVINSGSQIPVLKYHRYSIPGPTTNFGLSTVVPPPIGMYLGAAVLFIRRTAVCSVRGENRQQFVSLL